MGRELYLTCPRGMDCKELWEVWKGLTDWGEEQETQLRQKLLSLGEKTEISREEAKTKLRELGLQRKIQEKLLSVLELLPEADMPLWEEESAFYYLAALGMGLSVLGISEIKVHALGEGTGALTAGAQSQKILKLLEKSRLQVEFLEGKGELLTLHSAAFLAVFAKNGRFSGPYRIQKSASAAGERPVCGLLLSRDRREKTTEEKQDTVQVLETNVDDCSGEQLGYAIECLMKAGALDASCFPIYMKKQRPAYMLQVICKEENREKMEDIMFRETTSIGLRRYQEERRILPRSFQEISLRDGHKVRIKICEHHGEKYYYPEYETVKQVCLETGRPYRSVYDEAAALAGGMYDNL